MSRKNRVDYKIRYETIQPFHSGTFLCESVRKRRWNLKCSQRSETRLPASDCFFKFNDRFLHITKRKYFLIKWAATDQSGLKALILRSAFLPRLCYFMAV
mgnify:CR=1 FL=1